LTLNKVQFLKKALILRSILFLSLIQSFDGNFHLKAQENYKLNEIEINSTTKSNQDDSGGIPTNPFEMVDMLRRINSMNDATKPSDAVDDALKSFDMIKNENKI
tara:strand:- start:163 stop:474 length:312 start_codon:yes stop_codon:yes gene_type:complete